jgi:hypothetical protein
MDDERFAQDIGDVLELCQRGAGSSLDFAYLRLSAGYPACKLSLGDSGQGAKTGDLMTDRHI